MSRLTRHAYEKMLREDLAWLDKQPRTLERDHIREIVKASPDLEYTLRAELTAMTERAEKLEARQPTSRRTPTFTSSTCGMPNAAQEQRVQDSLTSTSTIGLSRCVTGHGRD